MLTRFGHTDTNRPSSDALHSVRTRIGEGATRGHTAPVLLRASFNPSKVSNSTYPNPFGLSSLSLMILIELI